MPSNVSITGDDALTLDMIKQFTFCPRLFHLMYVEGRWADNAYTIEGRDVHRRVDQIDHLLPPPDNLNATSAPPSGGAQSPAGDEPPVISRCVPLSSQTLGLAAKLDLVSSDGAQAIPVETKRGRVPNNDQRSHDTHRVQLMAQALLLREHGYQSDHGVLYFAASRTRVDIPFTDELEQQTRQLIEQTRSAVTLTVIPDPLEDSPKCNGCSLAPICLPDETLTLRSLPDQTPGQTPDEACPAPAPGHPPAPTDDAWPDTGPDVRRLYPARSPATPLYIQTQGAFVGKRGQSLLVRAEGREIAHAALKDISQLVLCGNIQVSTQTMHLLCEADIPVVLFSSGWWFYGITHGQSLRNAYDRAAQFAAAADPQKCLLFSRALVRDKIINQRTQLRRNALPGHGLSYALDEMSNMITLAGQADHVQTLLGIEGNAARHYFSQFAQMLKPQSFDTQWDFNARNRRPPKDPVNAMLSYAYALLAKECTVALLTEGLDPYWGFYHRPRHGRPALALDMMEPLRPLIADSAVITAINTGMVRAEHFQRTPSACAMSDSARKALLRAYELRLDQLITHPVFDYRCSWRSMIRLQACLLARWLRGDIPHLTHVITR